MRGDPYNTYTSTELDALYEKFMVGLEKVTTPERFEKLSKMYSEDELGPNLVISPCGTKPPITNVFIGGYMDHIMRVVELAVQQAKVYKSLGGKINFTMQELMFVAFNYDLGKLGEPGKIMFAKNTSSWHVENRNEYFMFNPDLEYMSVSDRTLYTLQKYGIELTKNEFLGIRLAQGAVNSEASKYLVSYTEGRELHRNIPHIIISSVNLARSIERDMSR